MYSLIVQAATSMQLQRKINRQEEMQEGWIRVYEFLLSTNLDFQVMGTFVVLKSLIICISYSPGPIK